MYLATVWQIAKLPHASTAVRSDRPPGFLPDFQAKIMLGLGFGLWSAGNQQRQLTTSPMILIVEQDKENTVFDMLCL